METRYRALSALPKSAPDANIEGYCTAAVELLALFNLCVEGAVRVSQKSGAIDQRGFPPFRYLLDQSSTCLSDFRIREGFDELNVRLQRNFRRARPQSDVLANDPSYAV